MGNGEWGSRRGMGSGGVAESGYEFYLDRKALLAEIKSLRKSFLTLFPYSPLPIPHSLFNTRVISSE